MAVEIEENSLACPSCGRTKLSRDAEIPIFANCGDCGFSWNLFSQKLIMKPGTEEVIQEHLNRYFACEDSGTRAQWLSGLAKLITGPEMKIALQKIGNAVVIQRQHLPTKKIKWNYLTDLNKEN
ncbi:MAG: hypothetical protein AAB851_00620 [Patescibacteria group bacterium]